MWAVVVRDDGLVLGPFESEGDALVEAAWYYGSVLAFEHADTNGDFRVCRMFAASSAARRWQDAGKS